VSDGHAARRVEEADSGEQRLRGHVVGLPPARALIVRKHDDAAVTDGHEPLPG